MDPWHWIRKGDDNLPFEDYHAIWRKMEILMLIWMIFTDWKCGRVWIESTFYLGIFLFFFFYVIMSEVAQSCLTLCDPMASWSMGFSRQEYWSGLPFLSPGDLPNQGIKPRSPTLQADSLPFESPGKHTWSYCYSSQQSWLHFTEFLIPSYFHPAHFSWCTLHIVK